MVTDLDDARIERTDTPVRWADWLFALAFALLISHELDAMIRQEWLLFPGLGDLDEVTAADVFNLLHVPLFAALIALLLSPSDRVKRRTMIGVDAFLIAHAIAHTALRNADDYLFEAPVETITVYGAAICAAGHLALMTRRRGR